MKPNIEIDWEPAMHIHCKKRKLMAGRKDSRAEKQTSIFGDPKKEMVFFEVSECVSRSGAKSISTR